VLSAVRCHRRIDAAFWPGARTCPGLPLPRFAPAHCLAAQDGSLKGLEGVPLAHHLITAAHRRRLHRAGEPRGASASGPRV